MLTDFEAEFGMTIHERAAKLMEEEIAENPEPCWWYLSYAHVDEGFMGGAIILAHGFVGACDHARRLKLMRWPDVETQGFGPIPGDQIPAEEYRNRLLTRAELEELWGPMSTMEEWEAKNNAE